MRSVYRLSCALVLFAAGIAAVASPTDARLLDVEPPPAVASAVAGDRFSAIAADAGGGRFAVARRLVEKAGRSEVLLFSPSAGEPRLVRVNGLVRDLWFVPAGEALLGIVAREQRRGPGSADLLQIDMSTATSRRIMRLPPTAAALDHWVDRNALLIACANEIRSILLPGFRSGPLYRIPGPNLSITALDTGGRILVGRPDGIWSVDLTDRPGEDSMPIRERLTTAAPVISLATSPDGTRTLALTEAGAVLAVTSAPLSAAPAGTGVAVEASGSKSLARATLAAAVVEPTEIEPPSIPEPVAEERPAPPPTDESTPTPSPVPVERPIAGQPTPEPTPEPAPEPADVSPAQVEPPSGDPPATAAPAAPPPPSVVEPPEEQPSPVGPFQLAGRIDGPAAGAVKWVVLHGPDNILREAARITPAENGVWKVDGLSPGRYRITLDGGGTVVVVSRPAYRTVSVVDGESRQVPAFEALGTR